jgi:imidazole glycerol-phosphate synthase subunit HisF
MALPRVIPVLLLRNKGLVKTFKFKDSRYVGDPFNAVKIFNEKEVDEIIILDIDASREGREPSYTYLKEIASECFMPLSYGGGVKTIDQIKRLIQSGIEKIILNSEAIRNPGFVESAAKVFGSSTIIGAFDVKNNFWGTRQVFNHTQGKTINLDPVKHAIHLEQLGVGEIFINNVDRDGTREGYDLDLIKSITEKVNVSVIACGGCGSIQDIGAVVNNAHARAAAAGSFFVFHGKHQAVLITYPPYDVLKQLFN